MNKISKKVLEKIEKKEIEPRPKWQFITMHVLLGILLIFTVLIGSFATGIMLHKLMATEWDFVPRIGGGPIQGFLLVLPYVWILALFVSTFVAYKLFAETKGGYRHHPIIILLGSIILSLVIGTVLFVTKVADITDNALQTHFRPYAEYQELREKIWNAPQEGMLIGRVINVTPREVLVLNDVTGETWNVDIKNVKRMPTLKEWDIVIAIGESTKKGEFDADYIKMPKKENFPRLREKLPLFKK